MSMMQTEAAAALHEAMPAEVLRVFLTYDADTGALTWNERDRCWFKRDRSWKTWNTRFAGKPALAAINRDGYLAGLILGRGVLAHRVAWAIHHGEWPADQIDHENGVRTDNRLSNLRVVSHVENGRNQRMPKNNTSGRVGVSWIKREKKWLAQIRVGGRGHNLGYFDCFDDAVAARAKAEQKYGFHENHGRPAEPVQVALDLGGDE